MKGNKKLVNTLNALLKDEMTAINQYMLHAEMCEDWGYGKLSAAIKDRAITEMRHAEKLIERILFLEGSPEMSAINKLMIGSDVPTIIENDRKAEADAIKHYNDAIVLAGEVKDYATRDVLVEILNDEDSHIDNIEELQDQIDQMELPNFLTTQL